MTLTQPLPRRSVQGYRGGRPLGSDLWFAPRDGDLYPAESETIRTVRREPTPPEGQALNWVWALAHARNNGMWLVVQLTSLDLSRESADVRSSLIRTGKRIGLRLTTQKVGDRLYVWPSDAP